MASSGKTDETGETEEASAAKSPTATGKTGKMKALGNWLDERTGYRATITAALDEPVPGGASFAYVFGSVLSFILVLQMTTGVFLAMYYSPSATDAWASVAYIQDDVTLGWFVRGLHAHGASAMVIFAGFHLLQTALYGAYKKPREINWLLGCLMLGLILAFALTGYLLPWDQTGYWATQVATGIAGTAPGAGEQMQAAIQGGNQYGNLTLTRFFSIHVFILPATMIALVAMHVVLFRKHGVTPRWDKSAKQLAAKIGRFWPDQMFVDMVAIALVFGALVATVVLTGGATLEAPADPASNFDARPEWYFRALFQALKYFHGTMEHVVALGLPVVIGGIFVLVPFLDRGDDRNPLKRLKYLSLIGAVFFGAAALTVVSFREDAADEKLQTRIALADERAQGARELAKSYGVPAAGGASVFSMKPDLSPRGLYGETGSIPAVAAALFERHCATCHDEGEDREAPLLEIGYNSRPWIRGFLEDPNGAAYMGKVEKISGKKNVEDAMEPVELPEDEMTAVVEYVYSLSLPPDVDAALADKGKELFADGDCSDCHDVEAGEKLGDGPNLLGRGSRDTLIEFIADPGKELWFGKMNDMPVFAKKLSATELAALADYIVWLRSGPEAK